LEARANEVIDAIVVRRQRRHRYHISVLVLGLVTVILSYIVTGRPGVAAIVWAVFLVTSGLVAAYADRQVWPAQNLLYWLESVGARYGTTDLERIEADSARSPNAQDDSNETLIESRVHAARRVALDAMEHGDRSALDAWRRAAMSLEDTDQRRYQLGSIALAEAAAAWRSDSETAISTLTTAGRQIGHGRLRMWDKVRLAIIRFAEVMGYGIFAGFLLLITASFNAWPF
jgi:hypothetical protein